MGFQKSLCLFLVFFCLVLCASHAYTFNVGGRDGWTLNPSENYNQWSQRMRFLVNDTLHFKYKNGSDSVLVVNKGDYDNCNTNNPITRMDGGDSLFTFDRSGPFYFISGNKSNCDQGEKLLIVVLAIRNKPTRPTTPPTSPPHAISPTPSSPELSPSPSLAPSATPISPSTSPVSPPGGNPAPAPANNSPQLSPSATPISPSNSPVSTPGGNTAPSPGNNPSEVNAPPPASSSAGLSFIAPSNVSLIMLSLVLGGFVNSLF